MIPSHRIITGHCLDGLATLPDKSIHTVVTSPPYWGLRAYGTSPLIWDGNPECDHQWSENREYYGGLCGLCGAWRGEYGSEPTPDLFVKHTVTIFREVRRVLRDDGTLWLNIGDSFAASGHGWGGGSFSEKSSHSEKCGGYKGRKPPACWNLKKKDLIGIPWAVATALRSDGWYLRSDIVWNKPNPQPESVTDRPTRAHEYMFLLAKSEKYFYDKDAIKEPSVTGDGTFKNKRSVWTIPVSTYREAHFATFPEKLVEPCILAGTSRHGACWTCGAPFKVTSDGRLSSGCNHLNKSRGRSTVLDLFSGSGTTGVISVRHDHNYIGMELNPDYAALSEKRIGQEIDRLKQRSLFG